MAVSLTQLATYVGTSPDDAALEGALGTATVLIEDVLAGAYREVPDSVVDRLVLEVGQEMLKRKDSPSGNSQYADFATGQPVSAPRDPLARCWPIIRRYVMPL